MFYNYVGNNASTKSAASSDMVGGNNFEPLPPSSNSASIECYISEVPQQSNDTLTPLDISGAVSLSQCDECIKLQAKLERNRQKVHYYYEKLKEEESRFDLMSERYEQKICTTRNLWKKKIFNEGCRSGKILKMSMIKNAELLTLNS